MTLAPLVRPDIRGVEGKPADISQWCVVPGCLSLAQQRHHLWPKSYLRGQPYEWVKVGERVMPNSVGLCIRHHHAVSSPVGGHQAHIRWSEKLEIFEWWEQEEEEEWENLGPLRGQALVEPEPLPRRVQRTEGICPTCGHAEKRKRNGSTLPTRKARTWTILVPDDSETGAEVLDVYIEDLAILMGLDSSSQRLLRYHVLVPSLEWISQHKPDFISDWEEAQE